MKKNLLLVTASFVALSFAAPAMAADLRAPAPAYTKAPPMMPMLYDWSGFYVGINGGGGWSHNSWRTVDGLDSLGSNNASGGTVGGQIGYRWQAANWVFGVEGQGNWADFSGSHINPLVTDLALRSRIDSFGLITGQVGYAWNNVLLYVKGGAAVVQNKNDVRVAPGFIDSGTLVASANNESRWGGTVGVGLEVGFSQNWTVGVEYDHIFLGNRNVNFFENGTLFDIARIRQDVDLALVRLNYRFGGPIVARY